MLPSAADRPKLARALDVLTAAVEELLLSGLTTASESTRQTLTVAMQEAARFRLLRLGSSLRGAAEELGRYTRQDPAFSRRRLAFFVNRSWLLSRGLSHALQQEDHAEYDRLAWTPPSVPIPEIEVVCLGVAKKVAAGSFAAFDFRLRALAAAGPIAAGARLSWSVIFPMKPDADIPPEGFLHLPQKQKYTPTVFLNRTSVFVRESALVADESGGGRITLTERSTVVSGRTFGEWGKFLHWTPEPALERLDRHRAGPLDVETELQDEVILRNYAVGPPGDGDEPGQLAYPITAGPLEFHALVGAGIEGKALKKGIDDVRKLKKNRPPLFGLLHYERCRLVLQPLSIFGDDGPDYLTISKDHVNKAALLKAMSFT